tara:strand:+ start:1063 stop:1725 length:663 start_codon:yes stop_codon:yes gene_type:complete
MGSELLKSEELMEWESRKRARFVNSLSGFKSANLVGTHHPEFGDNLSIVSSVVHLGSTPPMMGFVLRPPGEESHTYNNIKSTGVCTLSHVNEDIIEESHQTSARYSRGCSEFDEVGLTPRMVSGWVAPCVEESKVKMGLSLVEDTELANGCRFMTCAVEWFEVESEGFCSDGYVDLHGLGGVSISGLDGYHRTPGISRLSYAKIDREIEKREDFREGWAE